MLTVPLSWLLQHSGVSDMLRRVNHFEPLTKICFLNIKKGDDPKVEVARNIIADCGGIAESDRCETAAKAEACSVESAKKHGFNFQKDFL